MVSTVARRWLRRSFREMGWRENISSFRYPALVGDITDVLSF